MGIEASKELAALLRAAASQTVSETDFWDQLKWLSDPASDPIAALAYETATHYWGNFHEVNLLGFRCKPDPHQVQQGRDELNLIAEGLDGNWPHAALERRLKDI